MKNNLFSKLYLIMLNINRTNTKANYYLLFVLNVIFLWNTLFFYKNINIFSFSLCIYVITTVLLFNSFYKLYKSIWFKDDFLFFYVSISWFLFFVWWIYSLFLATWNITIVLLTWTMLDFYFLYFLDKKKIA